MFEGATLALWLARNADLTTVMDQLMRELNPVVFGDDLLEILLDLDGFGVRREFEAARKPQHVCIDDNAGWDAVPRAQHYVRRLARDAGEFEHLVHRLGDLAVEFVDEHARGADDVFGFGAVEAGGLDELFDGSGVGFGEGLGRGELAEEFGCGFVHADVGSLRGEDRRDGQLKGIAVIERGDNVWVGPAERVKNRGDALRCERVLCLAGLHFG